MRRSKPTGALIDQTAKIIDEKTQKESRARSEKRQAALAPQKEARFAQEKKAPPCAARGALPTARKERSEERSQGSCGDSFMPIYFKVIV